MPSSRERSTREPYSDPGDLSGPDRDEAVRQLREALQERDSARCLALSAIYARHELPWWLRCKCETCFDRAVDAYPWLERAKAHVKAE